MRQSTNATNATHCQAFFAWYNDQHCHSSIGYMTAHSVHYGLAADMQNAKGQLDRSATQQLVRVLKPDVQFLGGLPRSSSRNWLA